MVKTMTQDELQGYFVRLCDATSQSDMANSLKISPAYVNDLYHGKRLINEAVAAKLGFQREIIFKKMIKPLDTFAEV